MKLSYLTRYAIPLTLGLLLVLGFLVRLYKIDNPIADSVLN